MSEQRNHRHLRVVSDRGQTPEEIYTKRVAELVAQDHFDRPEAAASASTAAKLAKVFVALLQQPPDLER